jgi:predicted double-glycine peptidase
MLLAFSISSSEGSKQQVDKFCGPRSLLLICQVLGVKANLEEISRLASINEMGTTMLGLSQAAQRKGLKAMGAKMDIEKLARLKSPSIAHIKDNHFFVVERFEKSKFRIISPPKEPYYLTKERLSQIWDGNVLVISKKPPQDTEEPNMLFEEYLYHFGKADQNQKIEHIYKLKNTGKEKLIISKVRTTCGCMTALLSDKEIPAGGEGEIKVTFDIGQRRGKQTQTIYVHSNDSDEPLVKLILTGRVKAYTVASPNQIYFGSTKRGEGAIKRINIFEGEERIRITKVESTSKHLFTEVFNTIYDKRPGYEVIVALSPDTPINLLNEKIIIYTDSKRRPIIEIPVTGEIKGPISICPDNFFFGFVKKGKSISRKVTLSADNQENWEILRIENCPNPISTKIKSIQKGKKYEVIATLSSNVPAGTIKGSIKLHTNSPDQPVIKVPVYGLIRDY